MTAVAALELTTTLEDLVVSSWAEIETKGEAECPVCGGVMRVADHGVASCESCGSELW